MQPSLRVAGASSTGYGNFEEMGPLDTNLEPRNTTWVKQANILYLDQPVGTGFSYVDQPSLLTTNNTQIANDMVEFLKQFTAKYPNFKKQPYYVFCESYGGSEYISTLFPRTPSAFTTPCAEMTTGLATAILAAIDAGELELDFRGIALGDSWIDPLAFTLRWPEYLRQLSLLTPYEAKEIYGTALGAQEAAKAGNWSGATDVWGVVEDQIEAMAGGVSFYNFLQMGTSGNTVPAPGAQAAAVPSYRAGMKWQSPSIEKLAQRHLDVWHADSLSALMNGPIRKKLGVIPSNVSWGGQGGAVFQALSGDFMKPVYAEVDALIKGGRIHVTVYEGQLDVICMNSGAEAWISKLTWEGMSTFSKLHKTPVAAYAGGEIGGFYRTFKNFSTWYIMKAGHMVPADNGEMAYRMVQQLLAM